MRHRNPIVQLFNLILYSGKEEMFGDSQSVIAVCTRPPFLLLKCLSSQGSVPGIITLL